MKVLIVGGSGLIGSAVADHCADVGVEYVGTYRSTPTDRTEYQLDKTDPDAVDAVVDDVDPDAILDTGWVDANASEIDPLSAWEVNAAGTRTVALAARKVEATYVYFSTDYVFRGDPEEAPYAESDGVFPINYYGKSKYAGEIAARLAGSALVLRSSVVYGANSDNYVSWALGELAAGEEISIITDQYSSPTYAPDLARASIVALRDGYEGVYHAAGPDRLSRYEFTEQIAETFGFDRELIEPTTRAELGQPAPRPEDCTLDSTRLRDACGVSFRSTSAGLADLYERIDGDVSLLP